jgi:glycosyltransferase involved in cell wall biosynthesis
MNRFKPTILVIIGSYLPGSRTGGPIRTTANMVEWLGDDFCFRILTADRDEGDLVPYPHIRAGSWHEVGKALVRYLDAKEQTLPAMRQILSETYYDIIYLDSVFASLTIMTLLLHRLHQMPRKPVIIPPRGHLHRGALRLKAKKKRLFLWIARRMSLYKNVIWHASTMSEMSDIVREFGPSAESHIKVISNLPAPLLQPQQNNRPSKQVGSAQLVFLSRISRKKNLMFALSSLRTVKGQIQFDIYGPVEDAAYWDECLRVIRDLPPNIIVTYKATVPFDDVIKVLSHYHLFLLPTLGENFGHVILEALCAGVPVLVSDQTPWTDIDALGAGWICSLDEPNRFKQVIQTVVDMEALAFAGISAQAQRYSDQYLALPLVDEMRQFFSQVENQSE